MAAQLPYLPPMQTPDGELKSIAAAAAEDVKAQPTGAGKAGAAIRGGLGLVPATAVAAAKLYNMPAAALQGAVYPRLAQFGTALVGGQPAGPTLGLPQLAKPVPAVPATQAPIAVPTQPTQPADAGSATTTTGTIGTPAIAATPTRSGGMPTASQPPMTHIDHGDGTYTLTNNPVDIGRAQQMKYAEVQRQAVLAGAAQAAAAGNPDNATARYMAALGSLPHLSGSNDFATEQRALQAERERQAEQERSNIRTTEEAERANVRTTGVTAQGNILAAENVRKQIQIGKIGEEPNTDPTTRALKPMTEVYGTMTRDDKGNVVVKRIGDDIMKAGKAPPVTRSEFITKNKKANPGMSESDIGREYDKKYGGKT